MINHTVRLPSCSHFPSWPHSSLAVLMGCGKQDFGGRARWGENLIGGPDTDENGHGTHVAGTIGGTTYGVAKKATLVAVKVLDSKGNGTSASVLGGLQWVINDATGKANKSVCLPPFTPPGTVKYTHICSADECVRLSTCPWAGPNPPCSTAPSPASSLQAFSAPSPQETIVMTRANTRQHPSHRRSPSDPLTGTTQPRGSPTLGNVTPSLPPYTPE